MQPGLHPLECSRCGAPLDPGNSSVGAVVRCSHCKQAHLWVAPDRVEAQGPPPGRTQAGTSNVTFFLVVGALVGLLAVAGAVVVFARSSPRTPYGQERKLPADAPVVLGDRLEMHIATQGGSSSCSFDVLGIEPDGRVLGVPCSGTTPAPVSRELLRSELGSADPSSIALFQSASGWLRGEVVGPEPGSQLRLRGLGESGAEVLAPASKVIAVQRAGLPGMIQAPLPKTAPLEAGDVILVRDGPVLVQGKLIALGDAVTFAPGSAYDGRFEAFKEASKTASRQALLGSVVVAGTKLEPGFVVLAPAGEAWERLVVTLEEPHLSLKTTDASGKERRIVKQGLFLIRVPDKTPPPPVTGVTQPGNVAPLMRGFKKCFEEALAKNPKAQGRVQARIELAADGSVKSAEMLGAGDLPPSVTACMKKHALATKLPPPAAGNTTLIVPVVFTSSGG